MTLKLCVEARYVSCGDQALMGSYTPKSGLLTMLRTAHLYTVPTLVSFKAVFLTVVEKRGLSIPFLVFCFLSVQYSDPTKPKPKPLWTPRAIVDSIAPGRVGQCSTCNLQSQSPSRPCRFYTFCKSYLFKNTNTFIV